MKTKFLIMMSLVCFISLSLFASTKVDASENVAPKEITNTEIQEAKNVISTFNISGSYCQKTFSVSGFWVVSIVNNGSTTINVNIDTSDNNYNESFSVAPNATVTKTGTNYGTLRIVCYGSSMDGFGSVSH